MKDLLTSAQHWLSEPMVVKFITATIGIFIINLLLRLFRQSLSHYIQDSDTSYRLRKVITFIGYLVIILFITIVFSDRLGQLTVVFGVVGAGIAFALQEVIASFAGWIAISLGQFYRPGDRVQLGGIKGDVIDIGILRTTLMELGEWVQSELYTGRIVRIANSFVFKEPVFNYSGDFPFLWDEIKIPVKYGSDHRLARSILEQVVNEIVTDQITSAAKTAWQVMLRKYLIDNARIEPAITLILTDNWMEFTVRYVVDYKQRRLTKDQLFTRILDEVTKTDGGVCIASTTIHLVEAPVFDVRLDNREIKT
ncbi:MAG: mechanosensitive ion channel domain-containing protein [Nostocaceae cyanobacterium]|nr:mechanosensitive ion channel domain-containing protein [Nostocaceae cyanobacterium]